MWELHTCTPRRTDECPSGSNASALYDPETLQVGTRGRPAGRKLGCQAIILIGFADVAERLVRDRAAIMSNLGPARIMLQRYGEQGSRLARIFAADQRGALVEIGFGLIGIEPHRRVEIGDRFVDLVAAQAQNAAI